MKNTMAALSSLALFFAFPAISKEDTPPEAPPIISPFTVTPGKITGMEADSNRMYFQLILNSATLEKAFAIGKPEFSVALDDKGTTLQLPADSGGIMMELQPLNYPSTTESINAKFLKPEHTIKHITLKGVIPVYVLDFDVSAIVTKNNLSSLYALPINSREIDATVTVYDKAASIAHPLGKDIANTGASMGEHDLEIRVRDPHKRILKIDILDLTLKPISYSGRSFTQEGELGIYDYQFKQPIPKEASLRIYYATNRTIVQVPFHLENVALP